METKNIFQKNMAVLEKKFPDLAYRMKNHSFDASWLAFMTVSGVVSYGRNDPDGRFFSGCSRFDPVEEGKTWFKINAAERCNPYVVMGFGLGYHVIPFAGRQQCQRKIAVIEASMDLFYLAISVNDLTNFFSLERLSLFVSEQTAPESAMKSFCTPDTRYGLFLPSISFNTMYYENIAEMLNRTIYECRTSDDGDDGAGAAREFLDLLER